MHPILKILILITLLMSSVTGAYANGSILCASTTSTQNSGLFDYLLPLFEKKSGIEVRVIAVGTGAALEIGKRGDADVVLVHAKGDELKMVKDGWFRNRHDLMYNDFVLVGPPSDPAGLKRSGSAADSFRKLYDGGAFFVSRGDNSGTNKKEMALWREAGVDPKGKEWYLEVGQGMAKTLRIASQKQAYTMTDRGTYLSIGDKERLELGIVVEGDPGLFNQYGVMAVNPEKQGHVKYGEAKRFIDWLISDDGQSAIASFRDSRGNELFFPNAGK